MMKPVSFHCLVGDVEKELNVYSYPGILFESYLPFLNKTMGPF